METIRPNQQRAKLAILFIWIVLGTETLLLISEVMQYFLLRDMAHGLNVSEKQKLNNDLREGILNLLHTGVYIISIVTFIQWFRRAYFNLGLLTDRLSTTDGWAAGAWFIPVMSLFRPYQMMKEMFVITVALLKNKQEEYIIVSSTKTVGVWWTFWIVTNLLGNIGFRIELGSQSVDSMLNASLFNIILAFLSVPLTLITVRLIKEYSLMETELVKIYQGDSGKNQNVE